MLFGEVEEQSTNLSVPLTVAPQTVSTDLKNNKSECVCSWILRANDTHLTAGMMPQVTPVYVKLAMIVHMHEFMCKSVLHMFLPPKVSLT